MESPDTLPTPAHESIKEGGGRQLTDNSPTARDGTFTRLPPIQATTEVFINTTDDTTNGHLMPRDDVVLLARFVEHPSADAPV